LGLIKCQPLDAVTAAETVDRQLAVPAGDFERKRILPFRPACMEPRKLSGIAAQSEEACILTLALTPQCLSGELLNHMNHL